MFKEEIIESIDYDMFILQLRRAGIVIREHTDGKKHSLPFGFAKVDIDYKPSKSINLFYSAENILSQLFLTNLSNAITTFHTVNELKEYFTCVNSSVYSKAKKQDLVKQLLTYLVNASLVDTKVEYIPENSEYELSSSDDDSSDEE